jgi:hypothetical protein
VAGAVAGGVGAALVGAITEVFAGAVAVVVAAGVGGGGGVEVACMWICCALVRHTVCTD